MNKSMDIFLIKTIEIKRIIDEYFFNFLETSNYLSNTGYFQENKLISTKYNSNYFFGIPFRILNKILQSIQDNREFLINNIHIPKVIW
jgi:hypothetical protein